MAHYGLYMAPPVPTRASGCHRHGLGCKLAPVSTLLRMKPSWSSGLAGKRTFHWRAIEHGQVRCDLGTRLLPFVIRLGKIIDPLFY